MDNPLDETKQEQQALPSQGQEAVAIPEEKPRRAWQQSYAELPAFERLTLNQQQFVIAYLRTANAYKSAIEAGYSPRSANTLGSRLLHNVCIREAISDYWRSKHMTPEEVIGRLAEQARNEASLYIMRSEEGETYIDIERMAEDGKLHLIRSIRQDGNDNLVVETHDSQAALVHIGRSMQLFGDSDKQQLNIGVKRLIGVSEDEF